MKTYTYNSNGNLEIQFVGAFGTQFLTQKILAAKKLFGKYPEVYIKGDFECSDGEILFMSAEYKVTNITQKYVTVLRGNNYKIKLQPDEDGESVLYLRIKL